MPSMPFGCLKQLVKGADRFESINDKKKHKRLFFDVMVLVSNLAQICI